MLAITFLIIAIVLYRQLATAKGENKRGYTFLAVGVWILSMVIWSILERELRLKMVFSYYVLMITHFVVVPAVALWYVYKLLKEDSRLLDWIPNLREGDGKK